MHLIVLSRFNFDRQYFSIEFNNEIEFAPFFVVIVIWNNAMCHKFLSYSIFIYRAIINVLVSAYYAQLYSVGILTGKQTYIALEKFKQIARACKQ